MNVYVASSLLNAARVKEFIKRFQGKGVQTTYDWTIHAGGQIYGGEELTKIALAEEQGVWDADLLFCVLPGRVGTFIEFGMALAYTKATHKIKPIVLLDEENSRPTSFYHLPNVHKFNNADAAFEFAMEFLGFVEHEKEIK